MFEILTDLVVVEYNDEKYLIWYVQTPMLFKTIILPFARRNYVLRAYVNAVCYISSRAP